MQKRVFGFDLGIASIGWSVLEFDKEFYDMETGEILESFQKGSGELPQGKIVACGVRCFPVAENPKDGKSLALARRVKRLSRRTCRRKARRKEEIKKLFIAEKLAESKEQIEQYSLEQIGGDVWDLRIKALSEALTKEELVRVLFHIAKHRGFQSTRKAQEENDAESGKVLKAIQENLKLVEVGKSLAQVIVEKADKDREPNQKGRKRNRAIIVTNKKGELESQATYENSIPRSKIKEELEMIYAKQKEYGIFTEKLYTEFSNIAFRQRGIKSVGDMVGACTFEKEEKRAPKEAPSAEFFVALSKINNLMVYENDEKRFLTAEERKKLFELLKNTKTVKFKTISSKIFKDKEIQFAQLNYKPYVKKTKTGEEKIKDPEDVLFYEMKGWHKIKAMFKDNFAELIQDIPLLDKAVTVIAQEKEDSKIRIGLQELGYSELVIQDFLKLTFDTFINLSLKALYKINPYLSDGLKYHEACEKVGYDFREKSEKLVEEKGKLLPVIPPEKQTLVPVVNRTISQFRKVYNAIVRQYGEPDQINIETAKELKKSFEERNKIIKQQKENYEKNQGAVERLTELNIKGNGTNITKFRLYNEQEGKCIYSGKPIDISRLDEIGYLEIDHILPYSRSFDNSQNNKVLVLTQENQNKRNQTPFEYIAHRDPENAVWYAFKTRVLSMASINRYKKEKLLLEHFADREQEFRARNANDNSYIATYIQRYLEDGIDFSHSQHKNKKKIFTCNGSVTAFLRHQWGLEKIRSEGDKHHAQDAIVIACANQAMVQALSKISRREGNIHTDSIKNKYRIEKPWGNFREDTLIALNSIFVSRPARKNATGSAHKDTIEKKTNNPIKVSLRNGEATKENMFRLDVYNVNGKYKIVPIYVIDLVNKDFKHYFQPLENTIADEAQEKDYVFTLYKDNFIKLITENEIFEGYLAQYNAQSGQLYIESSDLSKIYKIRDKKNEKGFRFENTKKVNISVCNKIKKYEVSLLGELIEIKKEHQRFINVKKR